MTDLLDINREIARRIIIRSVRDLLSIDTDRVIGAEEYIGSDTFSRHSENAGLNSEVVDTLRYALLRSPVQRFFMIKTILKELMEKTPATRPRLRGL